MYKLVTFSGYDTSGPHIFPIEPDLDRTIGHIKMARPLPSEIEQYIRTAKPIPGKTQLLIDAMGAGEFYGCFPAGTLIQTSRGEIPIEQITPGMMVLTHLNRHRPVLALLPQPTQELCDLYVQGLPSITPALTATPNHELWVVLRDDFVQAKRKHIWKGDTSTTVSERRDVALREVPFAWSAIADLRPGDMIAEPFPQDEDPAALGNEKWNTPDVASLMGLYAAEGCIARRYDRGDSNEIASIVYVTGSRKRDLIEHSVKCAEALGHTLSPRGQGDHATRMELNFKELAELCFEHIGTPAPQKRLSQAILRMPRGWQQTFFEGYAGGDGCIRKDGKDEGSVRCVSASAGLLRDVRLMLARQGIAASIGGRHNTKATWYSGNPIYELALSASQLGGRGIAKSYIHPDGYILSSVKKTETYEWSGEVYDLSVEEDHSYVASGVSVHNSNVNGDYFPEAALRHDGPDYGHKTFEIYAYPYKHHYNKNPARAYGEKVTLAAYDPYMHRVLLIVSVDDMKCQDILGDLANNRYWDVSMGCFTEETLVTMADGTRKKICDIAVNDIVLTHLGRARRVTETHRRPYKGDLYRIRAEAHETLHCTHQHPFRTVQKIEVIDNPDSHSRRWKRELAISPTWTHAECLDDHLLLEPVLAETLTPDYVTREFSRLLGYYLAEGHVLRNKQKENVGIELSVHRDDSVHDEIVDLCRAFGTKNLPVTRDLGVSELGRRISIFDERLARLCFEHAGAYAKKKRFSSDAMRWDPEMQREIIGAFANGDGHGTPDGSLKLSTSSTDLAWQLTVLLPRIGIVPSIANLAHKAGSGFSHHVTNEWVIHIGKQFAQTLRSVCAKVIPAEIFKSKHSRRIVQDPGGDCEQILNPIREIDAMHVEIDVYNFEVEEDNSFIAGGLAVHNCRVPWDECSICKNRAKNRAEYCPHLRYQMNKILQDGRRVFAYNHLPKFFDISFVTIGAEKASHVLKKVAHANHTPTVVSSAALGEILYGKLAAQEKGATQKKEADIDKDVPSQPAATVTGVTPQDKSKLLSFMDAAGEVKSTEVPIAPPVLDRMAEFPLSSIFSTLTSLGIGLQPQEFQRIVLIKQGARALADKLAAHRLVFDETKIASTAPRWASEMGAFSIDAVNEKIAMLVSPYIEERSCYPEILCSRLLRLEKRSAVEGYNRDSPWYPMTDEQKRRSSGIQGLVPASAALAAGFLVFKRAFPEIMAKAPLSIQALAKHPWMLPLLIGAGVAASVNASVMSTPMPLTNHGTGRGLDAKNTQAYHEPKVASVARLGLIPLAYMYSGIQQKRWQRGERINALDRLIAARPELFALGAYAAGPSVARGAKNLAAGLMKSGSESIEDTIINATQRLAGR